MTRDAWRREGDKRVHLKMGMELPEMAITNPLAMSDLRKKEQKIALNHTMVAVLNIQKEQVNQKKENIKKVGQEMLEIKGVKKPIIEDTEHRTLKKIKTKKMENKKLGKLVTLQMRNKVYFQGILCASGLKWTLLKYIPNDYLVDGYVLINNNYISSIEISENDIFKEQVLRLKNIDFESINTLNLDVTEHLLNDLKKQVRLIAIELKDPEKSYVGNISISREKSMRLHLISKKCKWIKTETFLYNEIRAIYFEDDYLKSLQLYVDSNF
jgi:hypothetical protein